MLLIFNYKSIHDYILKFILSSNYFNYLEITNKISPTSRTVRKDTIPTLKMRLAQESERERELKETVANMSKEIQQLRDRLNTANTTTRMYKETGAAKLALKLGDIENEMEDQNAQLRTTIPHMRRRLKQNDISKKQNIIETESVKRNNKKAPLTVASDSTRPELILGPTAVSRMPDLEGATSESPNNGSPFQDGFNIPGGTS